MAVSFLDCGSLSHPVNGSVDTAAGTTVGKRASYSCDAGYTLAGNSTRLCRVNGTGVAWSDKAPTCHLIGT